MMVTDRYLIREMNEKLVLQTIIDKELISRADLAKETKLNKATISSIVSALLEKKFVLEVGSGESSGGRKPIMVKLNDRAGVTLSIDLGPKYTSFMFSYLNGETVMEKRLISYVHSVGTAKQLIDDEIGNAAIILKGTPYGLVGICIGLHGIVDDNQLLFSPFYSFDSMDLKKGLEKKWGVQVFLENEANLSAIGEYKYSISSPNLICLNIKYGIGAGIILNDQLYKGANGFAGEIGHVIAVPDGLRCSCGNAGCLELYASEYRILYTYGQHCEEEDISFERFLNDYESGHPAAITALKEFVKYIAIGLNNLITSFNPEVIILNSKLTSQVGGMMEQVNDEIKYRLNERIKIRASTLSDRSLLLGASYLVSRAFLGL
ncbi:MAG: ROK family protein [Turicibacter sp.]|nr:ROK family protein [Turicibacter sp.]